MKVERSFLRTRVARRIFVLFVVCAVLPVAALSIVSFGYVSAQIERKSKSQLRQAAKSAAMTTFERLIERETELALLAETLATKRAGQGLASSWAERLGTRYASVDFVWPDGSRAALVEPSSPRSRAREMPELASEARLVVDAEQRILLLVPGPDGSGVVAEIDREQLLQPEQGNGFVGADHFLVYDGAKNLLFTSRPRRAEFIQAAQLRAFEAHSGTFTWKAGDIEHVASSWALFLGGRYGSPPWRFIVSNPRIEIFATASNFKLTLSLVMSLCLSIAFLMSATQIRRTMKPLETLREGTERISEGDYSAKIELPEDDEFAMLSRSFNQMSTRIREQFEEIRAARDAAESASRAKSDFLAMMSHEIRTPMNGILGMSELALETTDTLEQRDYLRIVKSSTESLLYVLKDVLDFARIERGEVSISEEPFSLSGCLEDTLALFQAAARGQDIELRSSVQCPQNLTLLGDVNRIRQVLSSLVGNALKFTSEGQVSVTISGEELTGDRALVHVSVEDTGMGIPQEKLRLIFQAFTQAESYMNRRYGGTGLGLATARGLIERMGGRIWAESTVGVGSAFHFELTLPIAEAVDEGVDSDARGDERDTGEVRGARILVAEDNLVNQRVVTRMLEREGHSVRIASNGEEAVAACESESFDLILMDLQMPLLNGLEASARILERARGDQQPPPIVALTAHASEEDAQHCRRAGMVDVLTKPLSTDALSAMLKKYLARSPVAS